MPGVEAWAVIARLSGMEFVVTALWVFASITISLAAKFGCTPACSASAPSMPPMPMLDGNSMAMMGCAPTVTIEQALTTGFAAAAAAGMSFNAHSTRQPDKLYDATHSGAHFNPAVSLSLALRGRLPRVRLPIYVLAQLFGGILGAALSVAVAGNHACLKGVLEMKMMLTSGGEILLQTMLVAFLTLVYHWAQCRHAAMATPIFIGFTYIMAYLPGFSLLRGHVVNPTRAFGLAAIGAEDWGWTWRIWIGSLCGSVLGAALDALLFDDRIWDRWTEDEPLVSPQATSVSDGQVGGNPDGGSGEPHTVEMSDCCLDNASNKNSTI